MRAEILGDVRGYGKFWLLLLKNVYTNSIVPNDPIASLEVN